MCLRKFYSLNHNIITKYQVVLELFKKFFQVCVCVGGGRVHPPPSTYEGLRGNILRVIMEEMFHSYYFIDVLSQGSPTLTLATFPSQICFFVSFFSCLLFALPWTLPCLNFDFACNQRTRFAILFLKHLFLNVF